MFNLRGGVCESDECVCRRLEEKYQTVYIEEAIDHEHDGVCDSSTPVLHKF